MSDELLERLQAINLETVENVTPDELGVVFSMIEDRRNVMDTMTQKPRRGEIGIAVRRWHPALAVASAMVLVLLVLGGGTLLTRDSDQTVADEPIATTAPPISETSSTTQVPATVASIAPIAAPTQPSMTWTRVPDSDAFVDGDILAMIEAGPGLLAVGTYGVFNGYDDQGFLDWSVSGAVWSSVGGINWERTGDPVVFQSESEDVWINAVTAGPHGIVAVGRDGLDAAVWYSPDGAEWARVPLDDDVLGGSGTAMEDVTAGGPGFVAVGSARGEAAVWVSANGTSWQMVQDADLAPESVPSVLFSVDVGGPGFIAAGRVGFDFPTFTNNGFRPAVWVSADGREWERISETAIPGGDGSLGEGWIDALRSGAGGTIALGYVEGGNAIWLSSDGYAWDHIASGIMTGSAARLVGAVWDDEALVVIGHDNSGRIWVSPGAGIAWQSVPSDGAVVTGAPLGLIKVGDTLVMFGLTGEFGQDGFFGQHAAIWIGSWDQ